MHKNVLVKTEMSNCVSLSFLGVSYDLEFLHVFVFPTFTHIILALLCDWLRKCSIIGWTPSGGSPGW